MTVDQEPQVDDADGADDLGVGDPSGGADAGEQRTRKRWPRVAMGWLRERLARWRLILLAVAVVAAMGLAGGLFFFQYRPDQQTDHGAAQAAITAASEGAVAILSYTPVTVDQDLAVAQSYLTGEFGRYYREFGQHYVAPAVRQQDVKAAATVLRAAVSELRPDSAVVLLFIHQTTTSKDKPQPVVASNNVRATLTKVNGTWLISHFEPI